MSECEKLCGRVNRVAEFGFSVVRNTALVVLLGLAAAFVIGYF